LRRELVRAPLYFLELDRMINLITAAPWERIQSLVEKQPGRCHVAVAYFGAGASKLLPLRTGSVLVVDMSERAVKSGQTKPSEISRLLRWGVEVHSVENLHAKVFVIGSRALVGSTNVSSTSANGLVEALLETNAREPVRESRRFVRELEGEVISLEYARQMQRFYKPPRFGKGKPKRELKHTHQPVHSPLWIVPTWPFTPDTEDEAQAEEGRLKARRRKLHPRASNLDEFYWHGPDLVGRLDERDLVIQVTEEAGRHVIFPQARVLHIQEYRKGRSRHGVVYTEIPKRLRRKSVQSVVKRLGRGARFLGSLQRPQILRDRGFAHRLLNLWSR
jgi:hypothetical protein